jgi:TonB-linked SusC/RagA family outer membrane protein
MKKTRAIFSPFRDEVRLRIRKMKLTVLMVFLVMASFGNSFSQVTLSLQFNNAHLQEVLGSIEKKTNYVFLYKDNVLDESKEISVDFEDAKFDEVLKSVCEQGNIDFEVRERQIILTEKASLPETSSQQQVKKKSVSGKVTDEKGQTVPGASVIVKGTTNGVITALNGSFTLANVPENATLQVSFVGMKTQEFPVAGKTNFNVVMVDETVGLEDIIVVGYGTQKKVTVVGAVTAISTRELRQSPTTNISNALAGRLPGLIVNQFSGGEPGVDQSSVFVRGMSTLGNQSPIVLVDGIERDFQYLNPEEVESFTILKDASATAVYGIRGANGVILVTTRRGKSMERANVTFKASTGISAPIKFPDYLGSADYAQLYNEANLNDNPLTTKALFTPAQIDNYRIAKGDNSDGLGYNVNLFDYAFKPSMQTDYSLNIQGGTKTVKYFVLVGYMNQNGNYQHTNDGPKNTNAVFNRYNFRSNIDINITNDFYVKLNLGGRIQNRIAPGTTAARLITIANTQPSIYPVINERNDNPLNGLYNSKHPEGLLFGTALYRYNMLGELAYSGFINEYKSFMDGSFAMGHKLDFITKGLTFEAQFSYDIQAGNTVDRQIPHESEGYREYGGYATFYPKDGVDVLMNGGHYAGAYVSPRRTDNNTMNNSISNMAPQRKNDIQATLNYNRSFGKHNISALLLSRQSVRIYNNDIPYATQGTSFRTTYNYDERYLFEVNAAYNGSENFAKGHKYGLFPATAIGWVASNESFLKGNPIISYLKFRGSFGIVGNDQLPGARFGYMQFYTVNSDTYNLGMDLASGVPANVYEGALANPLLTWEKSKKTNFGIDAKLLKNRLSLSADAFYERRSNILLIPGQNYSRNISAVVGMSAPQVNMGIVDNKGIDLELGWNDRIGRDFSYYVKTNFSFARNKIKFWNEVDHIAPNGMKVLTAYRTGTRIGEQFLYQFDHFVANQAEADQLNTAVYQPWGKLIPGDVVYKDQNGDGKITDQEDRIPTGNPRNPEIQFGLPVGVSYKGFDASFLFQGATNTNIELTDAAAWDFPTYGQDIIGRVKPLHLERWTPATAATATYPVLHYGPYPNNKNAQSSLFMADASYVRLKTVEIGYSIPQDVLKKIGFTKTRFYLQGLNLVTWDKLKKFDVDPETNTGGDWYPIQRVISFGVEVIF